MSFVFIVVGISQILWWDQQTQYLEDQQQQQRPSSLSLAVVVAGSAQRWLVNSTIHHVIRPLVIDEHVQVDYFAALTLQSGPAFRQASGYMQHLIYEPFLTEAVPSLLLHTNGAQPTNQQAQYDVQEIQSKLQTAIETAIRHVTLTTTTIVSDPVPSANLRSLRILTQPIEDDPVLDKIRQRDNHHHHNKDAIFAQFPMKDERPTALERTKAGNQNMIRLFLLLELLWKQNVQVVEQTRGYPYDYVYIARDDTLWLQDVHLRTIIDTNPTADAYILSCNARDPPLLPPEVNDHGILLKRDKADVLGAYVTTLVHTNLNACHKSVERWLGKQRGCNSEMILKHVLKTHNVTVQLVPQSLLPMERAVVVDVDDVQHPNNPGQHQYCFHKFCQSKEQPLALPNNIKRCADLPF
jgi:hypothetical protein